MKKDETVFFDPLCVADITCPISQREIADRAATAAFNAVAVLQAVGVPFTQLQQALVATWRVTGDVGDPINLAMAIADRLFADYRRFAVDSPEREVIVVQEAANDEVH